MGVPEVQRQTPKGEPMTCKQCSYDATGKRTLTNPFCPEHGVDAMGVNAMAVEDDADIKVMLYRWALRLERDANTLRQIGLRDPSGAHHMGAARAYDEIANLLRSGEEPEQDLVQTGDRP
jgi:hypothetical protein